MLLSFDDRERQEERNDERFDWLPFLPFTMKGDRKPD